MKKLSEKEIIALLGIGIGVAATTLFQMAVKLADKHLDVIMRKLNMSDDFEDLLDLEALQAEAAGQEAETAEKTTDVDAEAAEKAETVEEKAQEAVGEEA